MAIITLVVALLYPAYLDRFAQAPAPAAVTTVMTFTMPAADAELEVDGQAVSGSGVSRTFETPALAADRRYRYTVVTKWRPNAYTTMTRAKTVEFRPGERVTVDLAIEDPNDRVTVVYVPTPDLVAAEMVKLAGITPNDVTYEPGVGDARITIAAVKAGARRGVGVDLDPERVKESRANVEKAGLSDKIEIRQGDALEQPDLGSMTVVFLYMGDHFNLLIRPYLWKQLPVGARVLSHRFLMGDWKPDRSITVTDSYGLPYEVHLWTITEAHKRGR